MPNNNNINKELEKAVYERNLEKVKSLLAVGADVNLRVKLERDTLLHNTSSVEITKELLLSGAEVNARNMYCETPLHSAITLGKEFELELVRELLKHGADVNATNHHGHSALNQAVKKNSKNLEVVKELLKYGADINTRYTERRHLSTTLDYAINDLECSKLLIKYNLIRNFDKDYNGIIDLDFYKEKSNYSKLSSYLDDCICEVLQMKTDEIKDGFSLYELVTNNSNIRVLCNNQLSARLAKIDYSIRYPIYNDIILAMIKPFLERADLLNELSKIQFYTKLHMVNRNVKEKKIILDYDSTYNITEYLSNNNLLNFIIAFDNSNKHCVRFLSSINNLIEPGTSSSTTYTNNDTKRARLE